MQIKKVIKKCFNFYLNLIRQKKKKVIFKSNLVNCDTFVFTI